MTYFQEKVLNALTDNPQRFSEIARAINGTDVHVARVARLFEKIGIATITEVKADRPYQVVKLAKKPDLRIGGFDDHVSVHRGVLYRRGNITQVWWWDGTCETWTAPSEEEAIRNFNAMAERWKV